MEAIPFNKPFFCGRELEYIVEAVHNNLKISGNGAYSRWCQAFFENQFGIHKSLLTTSCTDALEMAAILLDIKPGDEVIVPSFTFVSTANAFILRGAKIVFADCLKSFPNVDPQDIERKISPKTRAIVLVHYAGVACEMDAVSRIAKRHQLFVVEDAAQAIDSKYKGKFLGTFGDLSTFSFHETKNIICGEGGLLGINSPIFSERAEILWEKGTNRSAFSRGEVSKYTWVDIGSSFLPSEIVAAFLKAQLEALDEIQLKRRSIWRLYESLLAPLVEMGLLVTPLIPEYAEQNGHMFYILLPDLEKREALRKFLVNRNICAVTHYLPLERSPFAQSHPEFVKYTECPNSQMFSDCLLRLPLFYEMEEKVVRRVVHTIGDYFKVTDNFLSDTVASEIVNVQ